MTKDSFSTRRLTHPISPTTPISSTQFRHFFSKKSTPPHPPYPVEPVFCAAISSNKLIINCLHFQHIYQSVTANHPFCPLFDLKKRRFRPKPSPFRQFSQPILPISLALKPASKTLNALHRIPVLKLQMDLALVPICRAIAPRHRLVAD